MLHWLAFSAHPLRLDELEKSYQWISMRRVARPMTPTQSKGIQGLQSKFTLASLPRQMVYIQDIVTLMIAEGLAVLGIVKLVHFSVKEYLFSDRNKTGTVAYFSINKRLSHSVIAQTTTSWLRCSTWLATSSRASCGTRDRHKHEGW